MKIVIEALLYPFVVVIIMLPLLFLVRRKRLKSPDYHHSGHFLWYFEKSIMFNFFALLIFVWGIIDIIIEKNNDKEFLYYLIALGFIILISSFFLIIEKRELNDEEILRVRNACLNPKAIIVYIISIIIFLIFTISILI